MTGSPLDNDLHQRAAGASSWTGDVALAAISWSDLWTSIKDLVLGLIGSIGGALLILLLAFIALHLLRRVVVGLVAHIIERGGDPSPVLMQKANTLADVVLSTGRLLIIIIAGMMILSSLGVDIAPLIASAGIAGLAIGLGAQSLIRDMINGFMILSEDQFGVGDNVTIGAFSGAVEEISLRRTVIRAADGSAIFIPNGQITTVVNQSKGYANAIVDVVVLPGVDDTRVTQALHDALDGVQTDPDIGADVLEPPRILGITNIAAGGVTYRVTVKVTPLRRPAIERELRRRIYQQFREREIPQPTVGA
jgi:small conductance mechanosensitive channel